MNINVKKLRDKVGSIDKEKVVELSGYAQLFICMLGQYVCTKNVFVAQVLFTIANIIAVVRCFCLHRQRSDKVKDISMLTLSVAMAIKSF